MMLLLLVLLKKKTKIMKTGVRCSPSFSHPVCLSGVAPLLGTPGHISLNIESE